MQRQIKSWKPSLVQTTQISDSTVRTGFQRWMKYATRMIPPSPDLPPNSFKSRQVSQSPAVLSVAQTISKSPMAWQLKSITRERTVALMGFYIILWKPSNLIWKKQMVACCWMPMTPHPQREKHLAGGNRWNLFFFFFFPSFQTRFCSKAGSLALDVACDTNTNLSIG